MRLRHRVLRLTVLAAVFVTAATASARQADTPDRRGPYNVGVTTFCAVMSAGRVTRVQVFYPTLAHADAGATYAVYPPVNQTNPLGTLILPAGAELYRLKPPLRAVQDANPVPQRAIPLDPGAGCCLSATREPSSRAAPAGRRRCCPSRSSRDTPSRSRRSRARRGIIATGSTRARVAHPQAATSSTARGLPSWHCWERWRCGSDDASTGMPSGWRRAASRKRRPSSVKRTGPAGTRGIEASAVSPFRGSCLVSRTPVSRLLLPNGLFRPARETVDIDARSVERRQSPRTKRSVLGGRGLARRSGCGATNRRLRRLDVGLRCGSNREAHPRWRSSRESRGRTCRPLPRTLRGRTRASVRRGAWRPRLSFRHRARELMVVLPAG